MTVRIIQAHVLDGLAQLEDESVHCVVTSPPYYGLRRYGTQPQVWGCGDDPNCEHLWEDATVTDLRHLPEAEPSQKQATNTGSHQRGVKPGDICHRCSAWRGELGLEPTPDLYIDHLVAVFLEVRRVLKSDGTLWIMIGDSYANDSKWGGASGGKHVKALHGQTYTGAKGKDLLMIPAQLALALRADGWWLRKDNIVHKRNPMPESVEDRTTSAHEFVFHLTKAATYFYDAAAIREPFADGRTGCRNRRSVWTVSTSPIPEAHFATMPPEVAEICILAGCPVGGIVLDPFLGSGTTAIVADNLARNCVGIELHPGYVAMSRSRARQPGLALVQSAQT